MLEIFALIFLCGRNAKNARLRGRKGGGFAGLTVALWVGGEMVGFFIGGAMGMEMFTSYGVAVTLAIFGGVASYFIAKNCAPGDIEYVENSPPENAELLSEPETPADYSRAYWLLGGSLLLMLVGAFTFSRFFGRSFTATHELVMLAFPLLLATAAYLLLQQDNKNRLLGGAALLAGGLIQAFSGAHLTLYGRVLKAPPLNFLLTSPDFTVRLKTALISALIVGAVAAIAAHTVKDSAQKRLRLTGWVSVGAIMLYRLFTMRLFLAAPNVPAHIKAVNLLTNLTDALCIVLFLYIIHMLCNLKSKELMIGTGAKVWFVICAVLTTGTVIGGLVTKTMGIAGALVALFGVYAYILLLRNRREGFPLVLIVVLLTVVSGFGAGANESLPSALLPLAGLLNPLIAWLLIRRSWDYRLSEAAQAAEAAALPPKEPVKVIFKIPAIINTLLGLALFVGGGGTIISEGHFEAAPFFAGVMLGGGLALMGLVALVQCFSKRIRARKWLLILQLVIACGALGILLVAIISALTH